GIVERCVLKEVKKGVKEVRIDDIEECGVVEEVIEENVYCRFGEIEKTEGGDKVGCGLKNGGVGMFVDDWGFMLIVGGWVGRIME
uniref:spore germination protein n=1 Tax=Bacillus altitudinis TaxID=293387 RepID=UPI0016437F5D